MNVIHKELELIVGNTDWENKYRQIHKEVADFPLENIGRLVRCSEGLEETALEMIKNAFVGYESLVSSYKSSNIKFPLATARVSEIEKVMSEEKDNLGKTVKKIYDSFKSSSNEKKFSLAKTYLVFYEIAKSCNKLPWFSGREFSEVNSYFVLEKKKLDDEFEKERALIGQEVSKIQKIFKDGNYELMKACEYVQTKNEFKEYDVLFEKMKASYLENEKSREEFEMRKQESLVDKLRVEEEINKKISDYVENYCAELGKSLVYGPSGVSSLLESDFLSIDDVCMLKSKLCFIKENFDFVLSEVKDVVKRKYASNVERILVETCRVSKKSSSNSFDLWDSCVVLAEYKLKKNLWDGVLALFGE